MEMHTSTSLYITHGISTAAPPNRGSIVARLVGVPGRLLATWHAEWRLRRVVDELEMRDDRLLADIGIERAQIADFVRLGRTRSGALLATAVLAGILAMAGWQPAMAEEAPSVNRGARLAITSGCHDCHTAGYNESGGKIDPSKALTGSSVGFRGPWGTTYPTNLRVTAASLTEAGFVEYARSFNALPPMPWYNVHAMTEGELRSLHRYIRSLGESGEAAPAPLPPGEEPATAYVNLLPVAPTQP